jgi:hypothetical protein
MAGLALRQTISEVSSRHLSDREKVRIGAAVAFAVEHMREYLDEGHSVRDDDFFFAESGRSAGEEVAEAVLIAAQREHEEAKCRHMGYLLATIAFHDEIDRYLANWLVRTATELSWAQYVLLAIIGREGGEQLPHGDTGRAPGGWSQWGLHQELANLGYAQRGLVGAPPGKTERLGLSVPNVKMSDQQLLTGGRLLHSALQLERASDAEMVEVLNTLKLFEADAQPDEGAGAADSPVAELDEQVR